MADTTAPSLVSYELSSNEIDLSNGDYVINIQARITDDISGVFNGNNPTNEVHLTSRAYWSSPSNTQELIIGNFYSVSFRNIFRWHIC